MKKLIRHELWGKVNLLSISTSWLLQFGSECVLRYLHKGWLSNLINKLQRCLSVICTKICDNWFCVNFGIFVHFFDTKRLQRLCLIALHTNKWHQPDMFRKGVKKNTANYPDFVDKGGTGVWDNSWNWANYSVKLISTEIRYFYWP